jgi:hypothetical protein
VSTPVSGIPADRLVAVIAETASGRKRIGSGYLLHATRVLTAWHCTVDEDDQPAVSISVVAPAGAHKRTEVEVLVRESARKLDVALLAVSGEPPWGTELPDGPVKFGKLARRHTGKIDCVAVGFPRWQESNGVFRDVAEVHGLVYLLEGIERQRAVLRDPVLNGVTADGGPPWAGFSGAAVFHEDQLLGVVIEHDHEQDPTALQFRPVQAIAEDDDDASRGLAYELGIDKERPLWPVRSPVPERQGWSSADEQQDIAVPAPVVFRPISRQRIFLVFWPALWLIFFYWPGVGSINWGSVGLYFFAMALTIGLAVVRLRGKLEMTQQGVHLRRWKTTFIPWSEIRVVQVWGRAPAKRGVKFVLRNRSKRSWWPFDGQLMRDHQFEQKVQFIQQWHVQFGSPEPWWPEMRS